MKRILFEGTDEQINNLKELVKAMKSIPNIAESDVSNFPLPEERENAYVDMYWSTIDVTDHFWCSDSEAMEVLETALNGEWICEKINICISDAAEEEGIETKTHFLARHGIIETNDEQGKFYIARIDSPEDYQEEEGIDFTPPLLESDEEAQEIYTRLLTEIND